MQDNYAHSQRVADDMPLTIPASIVDCLRRAAYTEIGLTAEALDDAAFSTDREAHPEWFREPAETLHHIYALLDAIGWTKTTPPHAVQIEPNENSWTLIRTLTKALEIADQNASEATPGDTAPDATPESAAEIECADVLWNFMASVEAHTDTLAVEEAAEPALDLAA